MQPGLGAEPLEQPPVVRLLDDPAADLLAELGIDGGAVRRRLVSPNEP